MSILLPQENPGLLSRIARGDKSAMKELISQYGALVWSLALSMTRSATDAEDASQDVFLHLWQKAGQHDPAQGNELQFVSVLTRRRLIDWIRKHSKPRDVETRLFQQSSLPANSQIAGRDEEAKVAWSSLATLVAEQQSVLVLAIVHGLTHEQIASHLNIPLGTVKSNLYRGLAAIRDTVSKHREQSRMDGVAATRSSGGKGGVRHE